MATIIAVENVSLDGVLQAPATETEDTRDGFDQGGWFQPYMDEVIGRYMGTGLQSEGAMLFGRRTYLGLMAAWRDATDNPFTPVLNATTKYVVSTSLTDPLPWDNSVLVGEDVVERVREIKQTTAGSITVLGSGDLLATLFEHRLVDEVTLCIAPLVLGQGHRLFAAGLRQRWDLVECVPSITGVLIARYRLAA